ncbi:MAG TPA: hypothetical protein VGM67_18700 [Gemmatimonadaceae bacterium]|jgi:hypothetical protein
MPSQPRKNQRARSVITYADACTALESALAGGVREQMLDALDSTGDFATACQTLRSAMRSHAFPTLGTPVELHRVVQSFDNRARRSGLHPLQSWDYRAHHFSDEILPVLMLDRCAASRVPPEQRRAALSVLLDHYFTSVLGLMAASAWDDGDPNENLDRVDHLLDAVSASQPKRRFYDDAETLLLVAVSHYHPVESAYDNLLKRVEALGGAHRIRLAHACANTLGGHLRWGLRFMYRRDVGRMRDDNVVDYPWLVFSLVTLWRELRRMHESNIEGPERDHIAEGFVNGLTADSWLWTAGAPRWLEFMRDEHAELRDELLEHHDYLMAALEVSRPTQGEFSPLGFDCNFLCNTAVAMVATALTDPEPHPSLNALFTLQPHDGWMPPDSERQARRLNAYARAGAPDPTVPALIVYDPREAAHAFNVTSTVLGQTHPSRLSPQS